MGLKEWAEKNKAGGEAAVANRAKYEARKAELKHGNPNEFEGVVLMENALTYRSDGWALAGTFAHIEVSANPQGRVTAPRLLALGVFALAAKKTGSIWLVIDNPQYQLTVEVPAKKEALAREFASRINNAARRLEDSDL